MAPHLCLLLVHRGKQRAPGGLHPHDHLPSQLLGQTCRQVQRVAGSSKPHSSFSVDIQPHLFSVQARLDTAVSSHLLSIFRWTSDVKSNLLASLAIAALLHLLLSLLLAAGNHCIGGSLAERFREPIDVLNIRKGSLKKRMFSFRHCSKIPLPPQTDSGKLVPFLKRQKRLFNYILRLKLQRVTLEKGLPLRTVQSSKHWDF